MNIIPRSAISLAQSAKTIGETNHPAEFTTEDEAISGEDADLTALRDQIARMKAEFAEAEKRKSEAQQKLVEADEALEKAEKTYREAAGSCEAAKGNVNKLEHDLRIEEMNLAQRKLIEGMRQDVVRMKEAGGPVLPLVARHIETLLADDENMSFFRAQNKYELYVNSDTPLVVSDEGRVYIRVADDHKYDVIYKSQNHEDPERIKRAYQYFVNPDPSLQDWADRIFILEYDLSEPNPDGRQMAGLIPIRQVMPTTYPCLPGPGSQEFREDMIKILSEGRLKYLNEFIG
ncbi:MAG: hypothetical protein HYU64_02770 [Armatimonadetes bacterium]|nr:hypothetical protein [Armatimonadota bacterium]